MARGTAAAPGADAADQHDVMVVAADLGYLETTIAASALVDGRAMAAADEVVIDRTAGFAVGDELQVGPGRVRIVGLTEDTTVLAGLPILFAELGAAQQLYFNSSAVLTGALLDDAPANPPAGTVVRSAEFVAEDALEPLQDAIKSVDLVRALLWLVTAVIIGSVVFLSALERQRDFAILRAMGTPKRSLLLAVAAQAVLIALIAAALAIVLQRLILPLFPLDVRVPGRALWQIPLGAAIAALIAGTAGLRKVAAADPASAFAGPGG